MLTLLSGVLKRFHGVARRVLLLRQRDGAAQPTAAIGAVQDFPDTTRVVNLQVQSPASSGDAGGSSMAASARCTACAS